MARAAEVRRAACPGSRRSRRGHRSSAPGRRSRSAPRLSLNVMSYALGRERLAVGLRDDLRAREVLRADGERLACGAGGCWPRRPAPIASGQRARRRARRRRPTGRRALIIGTVLQPRPGSCRVAAQRWRHACGKLTKTVGFLGVGSRTCPCSDVATDDPAVSQAGRRHDPRAARTRATARRRSRATRRAGRRRTPSRCRAPRSRRRCSDPRPAGVDVRGQRRGRDHGHRRGADAGHDERQRHRELDPA